MNSQQSEVEKARQEVEFLISDKDDAILFTRKMDNLIAAVRAESAAETSALKARAEKAEAFVGMFPKTKDGVSVYPGMECWHIDREGYAHCYTADSFEFHHKPMIVSKTCLFSFSGDSVYSTRAAALAAKESQ